MSYYLAKLKYMVPKEGTDEMKKESKAYLVNALSLTEAEIKLSKWIPANFQNTEITGFQKSKVVDLIVEEDTDTFWEAKLGDENEKGKIVPFVVIIDGVDHLDVLKRLEKKYSTSQFIAIKKLNVLVEYDLIGEDVVVREEVSEEDEDFEKGDSPF